ncbi:MAG TPA: helix-turn-helix domain-containing protein [Selenomonadales bacterium]|nr:helix-turn-helix domain-containing protein [Selenomonadales bacterium]
MQELSLIIAHNLKQIREERKLSLDRVAAMTGVSKSMLGQIERGVSNPTVTTVKKLSTGLRVSVTSLINSPRCEAVVVKGSAIEPLVEEKGRYRVYPIFPYEDGRSFEMYTVEFDQGCLYRADGHSERTEEFITVFEGELTVKVNDSKYTMKQGDSIRFKADKAHVYHNTGSNPARLSMILYYPG